MKTNVKICCLSIISFLLLTTLCLSCKVNCDFFAEAEAIYSVTIKNENGKYDYYSTNGDKLGSANTVQEIIDAVSVNRFNFETIKTDSPLQLNKNCYLSGDITFTLSPSFSAITVNATVGFDGLKIKANCNAVKVTSRGILTYGTGEAIVSDAQQSCSAVSIQSLGTATFNGCTIEYAQNNKYFGYGIYASGTTTINDNTTVTGHSGISVNANATINGGTISSNAAGSNNTSAGYSIDLTNGELSITGGKLTSPILRRNNSTVLTAQNCDLDIEFVKSSEPTPVTVNGIKIYPSIYSRLTASIKYGSIDLSYDNSTNGYRNIGYETKTEKLVGGIITVAENQITDFIKPIESNEYTVSLNYKGKTYKELKFTYNTVINISDLTHPEIAGYTPDGWENAENDFHLTEDIILNAKLKLSSPEISVNDITFKFDGNSRNVTAVATHPLDVQFSYMWEKSNGTNYSIISNSNILTLTNYADRGIYRCTVTASYNSEVSSTAKKITADICKGTYENVTHKNLSGVYSENTSLAAYTLDDGFRWKNSKLVPEVKVEYYEAIYNADSNNYDDFELNVHLIISKAELPNDKKPLPEDITGKYAGNSLSFYTLEENFYWVNPDEIPTVNNTRYKAYYNPDKDNYLDYVIYIKIRLEKGDYDKSVEIAKEVTYTGQSLSELELPPYYVLNYPIDYLYNYTLTTGTHEPECVYNADKVNYNDYIFNIRIVVNKADSIPPQADSLPKLHYVYNGGSLSGYDFPAEWQTCLRWKNPDEIPDKTEEDTAYIALYNLDSANYNDCETNIILYLEKGTIESVDKPVLAEVIYNPNATLNKITLPSGWNWKDTSIVPTVSITEYEAIYNADKNYYPYETTINLNVRKAQIDTVKFEICETVYDGKEHELTLPPLPYPLVLVQYENNCHTDSGSYTVIAKISQSDTENYVRHPETITGVLTIQKAPSVIISQNRYDVIEGTAMPTITATVNNSEQRVNIPDFTVTEHGIYYVKLTTAESRNYLAGEFTVTIAINKTEKYIGNMSYDGNFDGTTLYGILTNKHGVPEDCIATFTQIKSDKYLFAVEVNVSVKSEEPYTAKILMTDEMKKVDNLHIYNDSGEVDFTIENGAYIVFETSGNNIIYYFDGKINDIFPWWWVIIGTAIPLIAVTTIIILWKKGIIKITKKSKSEKEKE